MPLFLLLVMAVTFVAAANAQVSKCTDAAGKVSYQDGPCQKSAKADELDLPNPVRKAEAQRTIAAQREVERERGRVERAAALQSSIEGEKRRLANRQTETDAKNAADDALDAKPPVHPVRLAKSDAPTGVALNECKASILRQHKDVSLDSSAAPVQQIDSADALYTTIYMRRSSQLLSGTCRDVLYGGRWIPESKLSAYKWLDAQPPLPKIGMSKEQAEKSAWKTPDRINSTTTASGVREQWVYKYGRYLYFENGVLTSMQESR